MRASVADSCRATAEEVNPPSGRVRKVAGQRLLYADDVDAETPPHLGERHLPEVGPSNA